MKTSCYDSRGRHKRISEGKPARARSNHARLRQAIICSLLLFDAASARAQQLADPEPQAVYREYAHLMVNHKQWRVTEPNSPLPVKEGPLNDPRDFLVDCATGCQNVAQPIRIGRLAGSTKIEAILDVWAGHHGTTNKQFVFNDHKRPDGQVDWRAIAELRGLEAPECYTAQRNVTVRLPRAQLRENAVNFFRGASGPQVGSRGCFPFDWGQWGWYLMMVRVHFDRNDRAIESSRPRGRIASVSSCDVLQENPEITVQASSPVGVSRVDLIAYYDGYDTSGNGDSRRYHYAMHPELKYRLPRTPAAEREAYESNVPLQGHIGTRTAPPYTFRWNTDNIPDQTPGTIKLIARIRDNNGLWYNTEEVTRLTLRRRERAVKLYEAEDVKKSYWVRDPNRPGRNTRSSSVTLAGSDDLSTATSAQMLVSTWNGLHLTEFRVNDHVYPRCDPRAGSDQACMDQDHHYDFDRMPIQPRQLTAGKNTLTFHSDDIHHGAEILWPGPAVQVTYHRRGPGSSEAAPGCPTGPPTDAGRPTEDASVILLDGGSPDVDSRAGSSDARVIQATPDGGSDLSATAESSDSRASLAPDAGVGPSPNIANGGSVAAPDSVIEDGSDMQHSADAGGCALLTTQRRPPAGLMLTLAILLMRRRRRLRT